MSNSIGSNLLQQQSLIQHQTTCIAGNYTLFPPKLTCKLPKVPLTARFSFNFWSSNHRNSVMTRAVLAIDSPTEKDKRTGRPKIWLYRDKVTNEPNGDATVTYEDPYAASAAVEWFNNKDFHGATIGVFMAESKKDDNSYSVVIPAEEPNLGGDFGGQGESVNDGNGGAGRGRGLGDVPAAKA